MCKIRCADTIWHVLWKVVKPCQAVKPRQAVSSHVTPDYSTSVHFSLIGITPSWWTSDVSECLWPMVIYDDLVTRNEQNERSIAGSRIMPFCVHSASSLCTARICAVHCCACTCRQPFDFHLKIHIDLMRLLDDLKKTAQAKASQREHSSIWSLYK